MATAKNPQTTSATPGQFTRPRYTHFDQDIRIGDVLEFNDIRPAGSSGAGVTLGAEPMVDRVESVIVTAEGEVQLWMGIYHELPGRMFVSPHDVTRIIERGAYALPEASAPPVALDTEVSFEDEDTAGKKTVSTGRISGVELHVRRAEGETLATDWQYFVKGHTAALDQKSLLTRGESGAYVPMHV